MVYARPRTSCVPVVTSHKIRQTTAPVQKGADDISEPPSKGEPVPGLPAAAFGSGPRNVAVVLAVRAAMVAFGVGVQSALARTLLPADRGGYALVSAVAVFLGMAASGSAYAGAQYQVLTKRATASQGASSALAAAVAGPLLAAALAVPLLLGGVFAELGTRTVLLALAVMPSYAFAMSANALLPAFRRFGAAGFAEVVMAAGQLVGTLLLAGWLGLGLDGAVAAFVASNLLGGAVALGVLLRGCGVKLERPSGAALRGVLRYGRNIHAANLCDFLEPRAGVLLLGLLASREEVGLFAAASVLAVGAYLVPSAFSWALLPRLTGSAEARPALAAFCLRLVGWSAALGLAALAVAREPFVRVVLGEEFMPVAGLVPALAPGLAAGALSQVATAYLKARGRAELPSYAAGLQMAMMAGLTLALYPRLGLAGAAWAMSAALVARCVLLLAWFCRLSGERWTATWRFRRTDIEAVARGVRAILPPRAARGRP